MTSVKPTSMSWKCSSISSPGNSWNRSNIFWQYTTILLFNSLNAINTQNQESRTTYLAITYMMSKDAINSSLSYCPRCHLPFCQLKCTWNSIQSTADFMMFISKVLTIHRVVDPSWHICLWVLINCYSECQSHPILISYLLQDLHDLEQ